MTPLKNNDNEISQKSDIFWRKFWKNIFRCFLKISAKFSLTLVKNDWLYMVLAVEKTKSPKMGNLGRLGL